MFISGEQAGLELPESVQENEASLGLLDSVEERKLAQGSQIQFGGLFRDSDSVQEERRPPWGPIFSSVEEATVGFPIRCRRER